ncbi:hypothetical protein ACX0G9_10990 [Flavitalea flava]
MKKLLFLFCLSCVFWAGCHKTEVAQPGIEINGILRYSNPQTDGMGHVFIVDSTNEIILSDDFKEARWETYLNIHATLRFIDTGRIERPEGGWDQRPRRSVEVVGFHRF